MDRLNTFVLALRLNKHSFILQPPVLLSDEWINLHGRAKKKKTRNHNLKLKRSAVFEKQKTFFFVLVRCKNGTGIPSSLSRLTFQRKLKEHFTSQNIKHIYNYLNVFSFLRQEHLVGHIKSYFPLTQL